jgi:ABC-type phosphate transport system auxiliary subunit
MATLALDTHRLVKRLKDAGFTDVQAETVTDIIAEARARDLGELATKLDLAELRAALRDEINDLRVELKGEIDGLRSELKGEIEGLRSDLNALRTRIDRMESTMATKADLSAMATKTDLSAMAT